MSEGMSEGGGVRQESETRGSSLCGRHGW